MAMPYTVQLRYIRTTHTRIIRSYFAYTHMSIRVYAYVYTRIRVCEYARICPFVMHSYNFLYMKHSWSNKWHMGMKRLQSEICILLKRHADEWKYHISSFRSLRKFINRFFDSCLILHLQASKYGKKIETVAWNPYLNTWTLYFCKERPVFRHGSQVICKIFFVWIQRS